MLQVFSSLIGKRILELRKRHGMTQKQLCVIAGVNQSQFSKMERGTQAITCCVICKLAEYFWKSPDYFFQDYVKKQPQRSIDDIRTSHETMEEQQPHASFQEETENKIQE